MTLSAWERELLVRCVRERLAQAESNLTGEKAHPDGHPERRWQMEMWGPEVTRLRLLLSKIENRP